MYGVHEFTYKTEMSNKWKHLEEFDKEHDLRPLEIEEVDIMDLEFD